MGRREAMTDNPISNIPGRITASAEMLEAAVAELLRLIPDTWQEYRPDDLTETQSQGLFLLVAAGMVERRERLRMRMFNHPLVAEATITCTGEYGGVEALQPLIASLWSDWQDAFREWKKGDAANMPPAHCERLEPSEWRLTDQGQIARQDIREGEQKTVFDFVLKRGFFDGRPRPLPDGRVSRREPVRGYGALVSMEKTQAADLKGNGAGTVNVGNWREGADPFAQAFAPILAKAFEGLQAQEDAKAEPPAKTDTKPKGGLPPRVAKVWDDFQYAIVRVKDKSPTDKQVWEWLITHGGDEHTPDNKIDTWRRYLRQARKYHGSQKHTPRAGRPMGSSIDTESNAKPINATEREHRIKRSINQPID